MSMNTKIVFSLAEDKENINVYVKATDKDSMVLIKEDFLGSPATLYHFVDYVEIYMGINKLTSDDVIIMGVQDITIKEIANNVSRLVVSEISHLFQIFDVEPVYYEDIQTLDFFVTYMTGEGYMCIDKLLMSFDIANPDLSIAPINIDEPNNLPFQVIDVELYKEICYMLSDILLLEN